MIQNDLSRRAVIGRKQNRGFSPTAEGSFRIENMRILADGAAAVREGFAYRCTLPAAPRAMLGADEKRFYVIAGSGFYLTDTETGESTLISEVNTSAGGAAIFRYGGRVYVLDGDDMWLYGDGGLTPEAGYVPLYGRRWDPTACGSVNEAPNLMTRKIRINYRISEPPARLVTGIAAAAVESFELNGKPVTAADGVTWSLDGDGCRIGVTGLKSDDSVTVCLTLAESALDRTLLASCTGAAVINDGKTARICCFDGTDPAEIFVSSPTSCTAGGENADGLYFPVDGILKTGDGGETVMAVGNCGGRTLVFTAEGTYALSCAGSRVPSVKPVGGIGGILAPGCAAASADTVAGVGGDGIYIGDAAGNGRPVSDDGIDGYRIACIRSVCFCRRHGEMWFCDPHDPRGRVLVYSTAGGCFCLFCDIYADSLFALGGRIGFLRGKDVYLFAPALMYDIEPDGSSDERRTPVFGFAESPFSDLGMPGRTKRIQYAVPDVRDGNAEMTLTADNGRSARIVFHGCGCALPDMRGRPMGRAARANIGPFIGVRYRIAVTDMTRPRIYGATVAVRK